MSDDPYSRVYWSVMDDPKFDGIRENPAHLGSWTLLLIVADMAHPAPGLIPRSVPDESFRALVDAGLVAPMSGDRFRLHGLASERDKRSQSGRNAAAVRWHSDSNARRDETSKDKTSTPLPLKEGRRMNGTNPRATGTNPRAQGTSPRQEKDREKRSTEIPPSIHSILTSIQTKGRP